MLNKYHIYILLFMLIPVAQAATDCSVVTEIPVTECEALVDLYHSTDGENWRSNLGWNTDNTPCSWRGVTCSAGNVTKLNLHYNLLSGNIPESLGNLNNLIDLRLTSNQLTGYIPTSFENLHNLHVLWLSGNRVWPRNKV